MMFLFIMSLSCSLHLVKLFDQSLYFCVENGILLTLCRKNNARPVFLEQFGFNSSEMVIHLAGSEKVFDIPEKANYITTFPESGSSSQLFNIRYIPFNKFKIMSYGMCLEYDLNCDCILRKECSNSNLQYYEFEQTEILGFELPDKFKGKPIMYYSSLSYLKSS